MPYDPEHYLHRDTDAAAVSLHDCFASEVRYEAGTLSFVFADGFWIGTEHPANPLGEIVRTDRAMAAFIFDKLAGDDLSVYVFQRTLLGRTIRRQWSVSQLTDRINCGDIRLEFLYQYKGDCHRIVECCLHSKKRPYLNECQLYLPAKSAFYCWNNLCKDEKW